MAMQVFGRRYDNGQPVCLEVADGRIAADWPVPSSQDARQWPWLAPGLIDIQVNGYGGQEFSSEELTPEAVRQIVLHYDRFGLTRCCPTLTTASLPVLEHSLQAIAAACQRYSEVAQRVAGIHLEGPYLSAEEGPRGAHPAEHCIPPDWDQFQQLQEAAGGRIRLLTMSVHFPQAPRFIEQAVGSGVVVAIGHTSATAQQIAAAVDAGARLSTHLGNGCHVMLHRHQNYIWEQLAEDRLWASLIADGQHLPPSLAKTIIRAKTPRRCILISDLSGWAGKPPGRYTAGHGELEILDDGRLVVAGQRQLLAGASQPLGTAVAHAIGWAGVSLGEAIEMASQNPARLLSLPPASLSPGDPADLIQFQLNKTDSNDQRVFQLLCTIAQGQVVWGQLWQA